MAASTNKSLLKQSIALATAEKVGAHGVTSTDYDSALKKTEAALDWLRAGYADGSLPHLKIPEERGDLPAIEAAATMASVAVQGMYFHNPPSWRMSRVWVSWSTMPATMNSGALKAAWLSTWNTAATAASGEPSPMRKVMRPRWLTVE